MSGPTKGMVAGQAIKTGAQNEALDEGWDRTFGERKSAKGGRWRWDEAAGKLVDIDADYELEPRKAAWGTEGVIYSNLRSTDGTVLDTRKKHRDYMKANGLTLVSEMKQTWEDNTKKRALSKSGDADTKQRRELIGRALHEARNKPRGKR